MDDLISRQAAISTATTMCERCDTGDIIDYRDMMVESLKVLPSAQPTLYGYNIDHLKLIANVLQKENLPPERVAEALIDISRIVEMVNAEFSETLRKAVEQCKI